MNYQLCGHYNVSGYAYTQNMTTCVSIVYDAHQRTRKSITKSYIAISNTSEPSALVKRGK